MCFFVLGEAGRNEMMSKRNSKEERQMETNQSEEVAFEKKKGMNLMVKILITAMIPLVLIVIMAGLAIRIVGVDLSNKLVQHELRATVYAMEMTLSNLSDGDYRSDGKSLYKGSYNLTENQDFMDEFKKNTDVDITLFWGKTRMATSIFDNSGKRVIGTEISEKVYNETLKNGFYFVPSVIIEGKEYYGYYEPMYNSNGSQVGFVFTGMDSKEVKAIYSKLLTSNIIFMIIVALIACTVIAVVMILIVKAIMKVIGHLDQVADGELDFKISKKLLNRSDEIGNIARAVHSLVTGLVSIVVNIHHSTVALGTFKGEFQKNFETINNSIANVNIAVDEIANGATSQADETQKVNTQINDMGAAITKTTQNVDTLLQSTEEMKNHNGMLNTTLKELLEISDRTKGSIEQVYAQTNNTNKSVMNIGSAINMITDIAGQTNLLSLNASIEAARAGEYGRGFAVVADEIRQLADQSSESAREISGIVEELIQNSNTSVETMNVVQEEMNNQYDKLNVTKEVFGQLNQEVNNVAVAIDNISGEVEALNHVKNDVLGSAESLAAIAEENAASTQETSAAMMELGEIVNECNNKTQELVDIANVMEENVNKFRVSQS